MDYARIGGYKRKAAQKVPTPQNRPIPGRASEMARNAAGGYGFKMDPFACTYRFLILGTEGGSYYVGEQKFTRDALKNVEKALSEDPRRVTDMALEVLREGRAFKADPALFVLALCAGFGAKLPQTDRQYEEALAVRQYALSGAIATIRQSTQLFHFMKFVQEMRGWGRGLRNAFGQWYLNMPEDRLALQVTKYKTRDGVSHRDLLRLAHPKFPAVKEAKRAEKTRSMILQYAARPDDSKFFDASYREKLLGDKPGAGTTDAMKMIAAAEELLHINGTSKKDVAKAVKLIRQYDLTHEMVPSDLKNSPEVWEALSINMPMQATLRNLGKLSQIGLITPLSKVESVIIDRLSDPDTVRKSRIHPMHVLIALNQYGQGRGLKGSLTWSPSARIKDALNDTFELSFGNIPDHGLRVAVAVDVSGSMRGARVAGLDGWDASTVAASMAFIHLKTESKAVMMSFDTTARFETDVTKRMSLDQVRKNFARYGGGTDTASPLVKLYESRTDVDAVITYTDNETWAGGFRSGHAVQAHKRLQDRLGHAVKFINCATSAHATTDADPGNPNMLEMVGFDSSAPRAISEFVSGRI